MGINERITELETLLVEEKKKELDKKFRLPFGKKVGKSQAKKNYVTIIKINENGNIDFKKTQIQSQTFVEDGVPRLGTPDYVMRWKNNPIVILPSWSNKPYSPSEQFQKSLDDGSNIKGYKILLAAMQEEALGKKKQMGNMVKIIGGLILAGIIGYAFLTGGGA